MAATDSPSLVRRGAVEGIGDPLAVGGDLDGVVAVSHRLIHGGPRHFARPSSFRNSTPAEVPSRHVAKLVGPVTPTERLMQELRRIEHDILARGKVDSDHLDALRAALYVGGTVGRPAADFLVELHKRVQHPNPGFETLFYRAIKDHVLTDGRVGAEEAAWLRRMVFTDGVVRDEERKFLHELNGEAANAGPEFQALFADAMNAPQERHTSGSGR